MRDGCGSGAERTGIFVPAAVVADPRQAGRGGCRAGAVGWRNVSAAEREAGALLQTGIWPVLQGADTGKFPDLRNGPAYLWLSFGRTELSF